MDGHTRAKKKNGVLPGKKYGWNAHTIYFVHEKLSNFTLALCNCVYEDVSVT